MTKPSELTLVMVDDNADEIFLTRRQVRQDGIVNNFVSERKPERLIEALGELSKAGIDKNKVLILLDINMPRANGFEALGVLRAHPQYKDIPVIMLSASDDEADMFEAFDLGANGYVVKPFKSDEFFAALSNIPSVKHQLVQ
ncbi:MAG: response regulator [Rhodopseudomonas sp.]|nr:response regulator [Rhodopseudomonas sp.]